MESLSTPEPRVSSWIPPVTHLDLAGTGGRIGSELADFQVDEVPLYELSGQGEHCWVRLEKRGMTTPQLLTAVAKAAGVRDRDIGVAGMKDKHAVTTQWISFLAAKARPPESWQLPDAMRVLEVTRHANKLRTGHLRANRFSVRLVGVENSNPEALAALVTRIDQLGIPNYFGAQRFGQGQGNLAEALEWLKNPAKGRRGHFYEKLFPSVIQSELFNRTLGRRLERAPNALLEGDVVRLSGSTRHFIVEDPAREQPRLEARDILLTGPMLGPKMLQPRAAALEFEQSLVDELGLSPDDLVRLADYAPGTRRDAMLWPEKLTANIESETQLLLAFTLDAGSYATQVVREFSRAPFGDDGRGVVAGKQPGAQEESA